MQTVLLPTVYTFPYNSLQYWSTFADVVLLILVYVDDMAATQSLSEIKKFK